MNILFLLIALGAVVMVSPLAIVLIFVALFVSAFKNSDPC